MAPRTRALWFGRCPHCRGAALYGACASPSGKKSGKGCRIQGAAVSSPDSDCHILIGACAADPGCGWSAASDRPEEGPPDWVEKAMAAGAEG